MNENQIGICFGYLSSLAHSSRSTKVARGDFLKFLQSSHCLNFKLTRKYRFELPILQNTTVIWSQQPHHFNQRYSYSQKHIADVQPSHAGENCIHAPWYYPSQKSITALQQVESPFSKAFPPSGLQRSGRSTPPSHWGSFRHYEVPSWLWDSSEYSSVTTLPAGKPFFLLPWKIKPDLSKVENKDVETLCPANHIYLQRECSHLPTCTGMHLGQSGSHDFASQRQKKPLPCLLLVSSTMTRQSRARKHLSLDNLWKSNIFTSTLGPASCGLFQHLGSLLELHNPEPLPSIQILPLNTANKYLSAVSTWQ